MIWSYGCLIVGVFDSMIASYKSIVAVFDIRGVQFHGGWVGYQGVLDLVTAAFYLMVVMLDLMVRKFGSMA